MNLNYKKIFLSIFLTLAVFSLGRSAHAITLSPVRIEVSGDPGSVIQSKVKILNEGDEKATLYKSAEGFEGEGETGTPKLNGSREGLPSWINTEDKIEIEAGAVEEIPVAIVVPSGTDGGGYYGALCWNENPPSLDTSDVSIGAKICSIVLVNVSGDVKEGGGILEYSLAKKTTYYNALPVSFTYRFQNSGNALIKPDGEVVIRNILGMKAETLNANPVDGNVLPRGGIRKFEVMWSKGSDNFQDIESLKGFFNTAKYQWKNFALGRFTAELNISFGFKEKTNESREVSFWVIPWQLLIILILAFLILILIIRKSLRSYNHWVIHQAEIAIKRQMAMKGKKSINDTDLS